MEDTLEDCPYDSLRWCQEVLILVLMEDTLEAIQDAKDGDVLAS